MHREKLRCDVVLLHDGWANDVIVSISEAGDIVSIEREVKQKEMLDPCHNVRGVVLPGVPNCHSHAHQRAMAGLGEKHEAKHGEKHGKKRSLGGGGANTDSFWSWRKIMYHYLERIEPHHLFAIARQLYLEMLKSGYTGVAEFQYLHHDPAGAVYDNPAIMTLECLEAASAVGIGCTALPVLYHYGGFGEQKALPEQRRFLNDADQFCLIVDSLLKRTRQDANAATGIAPHSLRAISAPLLNEALNALSESDLAAIHLHIAEQTKEVDDCLAWSGQRPVEWLFDRFEVERQWCLIHATHTTREEMQTVAKSGAVVGLCPTTEANLGDGFFNIPSYLEHNGTWAIGSDSHISVSPVEELRWLEYGQRLLSRQRNVIANDAVVNSGKALYQSALIGGARSSGRRVGQIKEGYRADFIVLDRHHPRLLGRTQDDLVDSWIFSGNQNVVKDVYVGGEQVIKEGHHRDEEAIYKEYRETIRQLAG